MTEWWTNAFEVVERLLPIIGTVVSIVLMWRRAGKRQVNTLAERVRKQEIELSNVRFALKSCEEARATLLEQNIDLLARGLRQFPPPGDVPA